MAQSFSILCFKVGTFLELMNDELMLFSPSIIKLNVAVDHRLLVHHKFDGLHWLT